jgi:hypothetical protein
MDTKIAIALPTNRGLKPKTLQSLLELVAYKNYTYEIVPQPHLKEVVLSTSWGRMYSRIQNIRFTDHHKQGRYPR